MNRIKKAFYPTLISFSFVIMFICSAGSLAADFATLHGKILDANGNPVAGADVYIYDSSNVKRPADYISNKTDADGVYSVVMPKGSYWAVARQRTDNVRFGPLSPGDKHSGDPQKVDITEDQDYSIDFTVANIREAASLNTKKREDYARVDGRIVDKKGNPVSLAYAIANGRKSYSDIPEYISIWTDKSGLYTLYLPNGSFFVGAATIFPPEKECALNQQITADSDKSGFDIILNCDSSN